MVEGKGACGVYSKDIPGMKEGRLLLPLADPLAGREEGDSASCMGYGEGGGEVLWVQQASSSPSHR